MIQGKVAASAASVLPIVGSATLVTDPSRKARLEAHMHAAMIQPPLRGAGGAVSLIGGSGAAWRRL
ncbi:hypothetical protein GCM10009075_05250 [Sphingomonas trueperi]